MLLRVKKIFWIIFLLFDLCLLAGVMGGIYYIESESPRNELEAYLGKITGRQVVFEENLDFVFYPWLGFQTGAVSVNDISADNSLPMATVKDIDFKVRLLPLLIGKIELDTVIVDSPVLRIYRGKDGKLNLPLEHISSNDQHGASGAGAVLFKSISVRGVSVENATCVYSDALTGNEFNVSGVSIRTGPLIKGSPVAFTASANLNTDLLNIDAEAEVKGLLNASFNDENVDLSDTSLSLHVASDKLLGSGGSIEGIASLDFDLVKGKIDVLNLVLQGLGVRLTGSAVCNNIYGAPDFAGELKSTKFEPKALFSRFIPEKVPPEMDKVLNSASFSVAFNSTLEKTEFKNLVLAIDDTVFRGEFSVKDYANPWVEFNVTADSLILDDYTKLFALKKSSESTSSSESTATSKFKNLVIADLVRRIPCNGKVEIGKLAYGGLRMDNCRLFLSPGPRIASVSVENGTYLDGNFAVKANLAFDNQKDKDTLFLSGDGLVSPISLSLLPVKIDGLKLTSGKGRVALGSLESSGRTLSEIIKNFKAEISMDGTNVKASLSSKDIPAEFRQISGRNVHMGVTVAPLTIDSLEGMTGRNLKLNLSCELLNPTANVHGAFSGNVIAARNSTNSLMVKNGELSLSLDGKSLPVIKQKVTFACQGEAALKNQSIKLNNFVVSSGKVNIKGDLSSERLFEETAAVTGHLLLNKTNCLDIFNVFGISKPATQDPKAFNSFALDSAYQINGDNLILRVNSCSLDNSTAKGTFEISNFKKPVLNFVLEADDVDVDKFLPPDEPAAKERPVGFRKVGAPKVAEWQFPEAFLESVNATGKVNCDAFRIYDFAGEKLSADVDMTHSVINIKNIKGIFHQGNIAGKLSIGFKNSTVALKTDLEARGFQAGLFFADYAGREYVKGIADSSVKLSGHSSANIDFIDTLSGHYAFKVVNGSYLFAKKVDPKSDDSKKLNPTYFSVLKGVIDGDKGVFTVKKFLLNTAYMRATAKGGFSIPADSINVHVNADIIKLPNLYLKIVNAFLGAISGVDVHVSGRLSDPQVNVLGLQRWNEVFSDILGLPEQSFSFFSKLLF
ncbi:AsmA family protein [Desulfovibrio gilichinskyi]|uniref:AsmA protein n=1 Tax=Desulfovibrio gilichinskyi TaxID=1519643 RepID=A0A1X7C4A9_9BACT|nr:AsmA family protein [Desulfovibrio gilichinskyi]SME89765.1 AsmA protein [Desulfovibrio gilichinskyi]